jgi:hypothetical protein
VGAVCAVPCANPRHTAHRASTVTSLHEAGQWSPTLLHGRGDPRSPRSARGMRGPRDILGASPGPRTLIKCFNTGSQKARQCRRICSETV